MRHKLNGSEPESGDPRSWRNPLGSAVLISFALLGFTCASTFGTGGAPPTHAGPAAEFETTTNPSGLFATDATTGTGNHKPIPGVAAIVDGHKIPINDVVLLCLLQNRGFVIDQMIQNYVVERDCKKRGITVSDAEIDEGVAKLAKAVAPATVADTLKMHHMSVAEMRYDFWQSIARVKMVADQIPHVKMVHARVIEVKFCAPGVDPKVAGTSRTEDDAKARLQDLLTQINKGHDFAAMADQYSEMTPKTKGGDVGVVFDRMHDVDPAIVSAAVGLADEKTIAGPTRLTNGDGYFIAQIVDTDTDHPKSEDVAYAAAQKTHIFNEAQFAGPKYMVDLINKSHVVLVSDEELLSGKPLPSVAATVDGHPIPMKDVVTKCMDQSGPQAVDMLVEDYVVDKECLKRGITVTDAEIDDRVNKLKADLAPATLDQALVVHHTTLAQLRKDFRQEIERTKLVVDQIKPAKMVRCRVLYVKVAPGPPGNGATTGSRPVGDYTGHSDSGAQSIMAEVQSKLKAGASFADLAKQYTELGSKYKDGDVGIIYPGIHDIDTAIVNTALGDPTSAQPVSMKKGDITPQPIKTFDGYCLVQAVSTSDDHGPNEDAAYAQALETYRDQEAQPIVPTEIVNLIKKSNVVYFVHS